MAINPLDLMEPEETVGNLWHDYARGIAAPQAHQDDAARLPEMRPSLTLLFRALGGAAAVEIDESPPRRQITGCRRNANSALIASWRHWRGSMENACACRR